MGSFLGQQMGQSWSGGSGGRQGNFQAPFGLLVPFASRPTLPGRRRELRPEAPKGESGRGQGEAWDWPAQSWVGTSGVRKGAQRRPAPPAKPVRCSSNRVQGGLGEGVAEPQDPAAPGPGVGGEHGPLTMLGELALHSCFNTSRNDLKFCFRRCGTGTTGPGF